MQIFSINSQIGNNLGFMGQTLSGTIYGTVPQKQPKTTHKQMDTVVFLMKLYFKNG